MKDAKGHGSDSRGSSGSAKVERGLMNKSVDERHFPTRSFEDITAAKALGQAHPKSGVPMLHSAMNSRTGVNGFGSRVELGSNFMSQYVSKRMAGLARALQR